jgi:PPK2 family polyphosphate:nucleotide phosphotransferase
MAKDETKPTTQLAQSVINELIVVPGHPPQLAKRSTSALPAGFLGGRSGKARDLAERELEASRLALSAVQELLYASHTWSLLVIFQALDAAGKDGTIKHVMSGVNPQGCSVTSFKQPSTEELDHDFLWHAAKVLPAKGSIGVFNRSYYEEVLTVRVHPELLAHERIPAAHLEKGRIWTERFADINAFESHLQRNGTRIVKFFLHVSKEEQARRLLERLDDPTKHWKFSAADLAERERWDEYQTAFEEALAATSSAAAPWYVIPADRKYAMRALVAGVLVNTIADLDLAMPKPSEEQLTAIATARAALLSG